MSLFVTVIFLCHITYTITGAEVTYVKSRRLQSNLPPQAVDTKPQETAVNNKEPDVTINLNSQKKEEVPVQPAKEPPPADKVKSASSWSTQTPHNATISGNHNVLKPTEMESGALLRGVAVVVILSLLVIFYMALKTYCGRRNKYPVMVNKYGVRTRRSDIEMTPLPLDEDDDDETLFEINNTNR